MNNLNEYGQDLRSMQQKVDDLRNFIKKLKDENKSNTEIRAEVLKIPNIAEIFKANWQDFVKRGNEVINAIDKKMKHEDPEVLKAIAEKIKLEKYK